MIAAAPPPPQTAVAATCAVSRAAGVVRFSVVVGRGVVTVYSGRYGTGRRLAHVDASGGVIGSSCVRAPLPRVWDTSGMAGPMPLADASSGDCGTPSLNARIRVPAHVLLELRRPRAGPTRLLVRLGRETVVSAVVRARGGSIFYSPTLCS